jgi:hypothetical protein
VPQGSVLGRCCSFFIYQTYSILSNDTESCHICTLTTPRFTVSVGLTTWEHYLSVSSTVLPRLHHGCAAVVCMQLTVNKTDFIWCTMSRRLSQLPSAPLSLGGCDTIPSSSMRDLGVFIDADLTMHQHVNVIVSRCFAALSQL